MNSAPEPVLFGTAIEALAKAMGPRITPDVKQELKLKGVDLEKLQTAYNVATWTDALTVLATRLLGEVPERERYVELGRLFMRGFVGSPLGIAALALSKLLGPRRALERMGRNFKQATNYLESEFTAVGATEVRLRTFTGPAFLPRVSDRTTRVADYRRGLIVEMLEQIGTKDARVEIVEHHPERQDVTFRITWS